MNCLKMNPLSLLKKVKRKSKDVLPAEQRREILLDPAYRHQASVSKKKRIYDQQDKEYDDEIRNYINGKD
jgi:hypothetical protein